MTFPFPLNPADGQQVTQAQSDGSVLVATYAQAKNEWVINRQLPAPTLLTGTPPINVTATADGQVITWDQTLKAWTAKVPAAQSGGVGGTFVKGTQAAADTSNPPSVGGKPLVAGMLQSTLENLHKEVKAWDGSAWTEVFGEDTIKQWISAGSLFRGVVKEATLSTLPAPATANRGFYYSWTGNPGYVVKAADPGIGTDLVGEILQVGDWVQSDGAKWVHVPGDLLSKQRWDSLGSFTSWSDTSWEKGSVVSYQKAFFRANALISPGDAAPGTPGSKWTDITPLPHMKLEELEDCLNLAAANDREVPAWDAVNNEWVPTQLALNDLSDVNADVTDPASDGAVFQWDLATQQWVAANSLTLRLEDLGDTGPLSGATKGQVPTWDDTNKNWKPSALSLPSLSDTAALATATDGQMPTWDAANKRWIPTYAPNELNDLEDVRLGPLADGQVLKYNLTAKEWQTWTPDYLTPVNGYTQTQIDNKFTALITGIEHELSVLAIADTPPTAPGVDDLYIIGRSATGLWLGHNNELALWDGTAWQFTTPRNKEAHLVEDQTATYTWNNTAWVKVASASTGGANDSGDIWQVGSIQQSMLTETQWATLLGPVEGAKWVLADGRNCAGTKFAQITGKTNLPDLRGAFLRSAGQNRNGIPKWNGGDVGQWYEDSTALPKTPFVTTNEGNHSHSFKRSNNNFSGDGKYRDAQLSTIDASGGGSATGGGIVSAGAHSHNVTGGDIQTAPVHVAVNVFIKIN